MYGYNHYDKILPEQVLQKVTQEEIFEFAFGHPISLDEKYQSPVREDKRPGCRFETREDGTILFIDFGDSQHHRTCFGLVMAKFKVTLTGAISLILSEFKLSTEQTSYSAITKVSNFKEPTERTSSLIEYDRIDYGKRDVLWWSQFLIKTNELLEDHVYNTNRFYITNDRGRRAVNIYYNCYAIDFISRVKLYQPFGGDYKFITNCDENNIGNIDNLPPFGDNLFIKKSYKDHRVLRNLMKLNVIWFQNEGCVPSIEILRNLTERFVNIVVFYDNDEAGIKAAIKIVTILNNIRKDCAKMIHLPHFTDRRMNWKDPSEFVSKEGKQDLLTVFKQITSWQNIVLY